MQVIRSKNHTPDSLVFNGVYQIEFPTVALAATQPSATVQSRIPLATSVKIIGVTAVVSGTVAGTASVNIVSGEFAYEGATQATGQIVVTGAAGASTDTLSATINGTTATTAGIPAQTNAPQAAVILAAAINANGTIAALGTAKAVGLLNGGAAVTFVATATGTAGNAITISATSASATLFARATTATLTGGAAVGTPTVPPTDTTEIGIVPPNTALTTNAYFATDQALTMTAELVQSYYPVSDLQDAIFPKNSEITLRTVTNGAASGNLKVVLLVQSVDLYTTKPQVGVFAPTLSSF